MVSKTSLHLLRVQVTLANTVSDAVPKRFERWAALANTVPNSSYLQEIIAIRTLESKVPKV